jgi:polyisoprenoid-binding protein YceI
MVVTPVYEDGKHYLEATLEIDRRDYGVGGNSWIMSDRVSCSVRVKTQD